MPDRADDSDESGSAARIDPEIEPTQAVKLTKDDSAASYIAGTSSAHPVDALLDKIAAQRDTRSGLSIASSRWRTDGRRPLS